MCTISVHIDVDIPIMLFVMINTLLLREVATIR